MHRFDDSGNDIEQRTLARAGSAEQCYDGPIRDRQIDVVQDFQRFGAIVKTHIDADEANRRSPVIASCLG